MNDCYVIKCQCCGECMYYDESYGGWVCPSCGYREQSAISIIATPVDRGHTANTSTKDSK